MLDLIKKSGPDLDACWGAGAQTFWTVKSVKTVTSAEDDGKHITPHYSLDLQIDPEPAHLNGSLYANGSGASATYANSGGGTYGYRWPGSWAVGSVPAGASCATYAAGAGTLLTATIQASGSYRKCR